MGSGAVPVLVALAHTEQAPVPHIDGDEQLLTLLGGHSPLPQDHGVGIDIVVDGGELLLHMELHAFDELVYHGLPVEHGEVLDDLHVVDILLKQLPGHIGHGTTLGEALLAPTRIYVKALKSIKNAGVTVKACSHITGGGFYENIPRMLKDGTHAVVEKDSYPVPPIFAKLAKDGEIEEQMMYNTFNMGLGMILAVDPEDVEKTMDAIRAAGDAPYVVGKIEEGEKGVTLC